jgi:Na+-driven multidrug efflux pump
MINDNMTQCRFCSVSIDPGVAQLIADKQEKANEAVSDASYLRTAAIAMYVLLGLSLIPFIPLASPAFTFVFFVVVVLTIRWQVKFGNLQISDPDYQAARKSWRTSLLLLIAAAPLGFIVRPIIHFLVFGLD